MPLYPISKLDANQVLKHAYDDASQALRTNATVTVGTVDVAIDQATDSIRIGDGTTLFTGTASGPKFGLDVNVLNTLDVAVTHTTDSIRLGDGTSFITSTTIGPDVGLDVNVINNSSSVSTPNIQNISISLANTEQSFSFPSTTKKFEIKLRGSGRLQISYTSGASGTNFITLPIGTSYSVNDLNLSGNLDIYFQSSKASETLEIEYWN
jgi:hypothetical protein